MPEAPRLGGHCKAVVQKAADEFGGIDILVNNAAFQMAHQSPERAAFE